MANVVTFLTEKSLSIVLTQKYFVEFKEGVYRTSEIPVVNAMRRHPLYGVDFWEDKSSESTKRGK